MILTSSYIGTAMGDYKCLFFLLYEDYIDVQTKLSMELHPYIERFARDMRKSGAVVTPFPGDIEKVRAEVMQKEWLEGERVKIEQTPGMLMINEDFVSFDPRSHRWLYINFGERIVDQDVSVEEFADVFRRLSEAVATSESDIFDAAHVALNEVDVGDLVDVFDIAPGIFGLSIDLHKGSQFIRALVDRMSGPDM